MQVGTTEDQGLYNKPWTAVHPGALAAGTLSHNITCIDIRSVKQRNIKQHNNISCTRVKLFHSLKIDLYKLRKITVFERCFSLNFLL